jgi:ATP-dependent DNA helicase RecQ
MLQKLEKMSRFCETKTCRRKFLLNYFGEEALDYCGSCDVCINKPVLKDATIISQKILSAVIRLKERFGMRYVIDILKGSNNSKIWEEHKSLTVYGIGRDVSKEEWLHYIKELLNYDYLKTSDAEFPVVQLTEKGKSALANREAIYLAAPVNIEIIKEPDIYQEHSYEKELFEKVKQLRNQMAREENVPPYIIFSDSTLLDLATYLPLNQEDLLKISGFGSFKTEKYGSKFLEVVNEYCGNNNLKTRIALKQPKRERQAKVIKPVERASDTKNISYQLYKQGKSVSEIAAERNLSVNTVESHLCVYISSGDLEIDKIVESHKQQAIKRAIELFGAGSLKVLKENLPEEITYGEIRMVVAAEPLTQ